MTEARRHVEPDLGAVDVSVQMLFGAMALLFTLVLLFEAVAFWHARNVFGEAASEGARVAAAYDASCSDGVLAARRLVRDHGSRWADGATVTCTSSGGVVTVVVAGRTPSVLGATAGFRTRATETTPKER